MKQVQVGRQTAGWPELCDVDWRCSDCEIVLRGKLTMMITWLGSVGYMNYRCQRVFVSFYSLDICLFYRRCPESGNQTCAANSPCGTHPATSGDVRWANPPRSSVLATMRIFTLHSRFMDVVGCSIVYSTQYFASRLPAHEARLQMSI